MPAKRCVSHIDVGCADVFAGKPRSYKGLWVGYKKPGGFGPPGSGEGYRCDSAYSARIERGTPCRVMCTPLGKSLKRSVKYVSPELVADR